MVYAQAMATSERRVAPFSLRSRAKSFHYAGRGLLTLLASQHNAWLHALATVLALSLGAGLGITRAEWCAVVMAIISVWTAEALNTAFEFLCDVASPEFHPLVEKAKDVAAGAVLICSLGAAVVGVLVFAPAVRSLFP